MDKIYRNIYNAAFFGSKLCPLDIHTLYGLTGEDGYITIPKLLFAYSIGDTCYPVEYEVLVKHIMGNMIYIINIYNLFVHDKYFAVSLVKNYSITDSFDNFFGKEPKVFIEEHYTEIKTKYEIRDFGDIKDMIILPADDSMAIKLLLDQMMGRVMLDKEYTSIPSYPPALVGRYKFNIEKQFENISLPVPVEKTEG